MQYNCVPFVYLLPNIFVKFWINYYFQCRIPGPHSRIQGVLLEEASSTLKKLSYLAKRVHVSEIPLSGQKPRDLANLKGQCRYSRLLQQTPIAKTALDNVTTGGEFKANN